MNKSRVHLGLLAFLWAGWAGFASQGCLSSTPAASAQDAGGDASGSGSGSGSSSSGGPGGSDSASEASNCSPSDPTATIDDMSGANGTQNATGGYWYTYSDRTVANSEPPILLGGTPAGSITPAEGQSFPVTDAGTINECAWAYREVVGGGENKWGAGFGMDFLSYPPDGGEVAFNKCDAGEIFCVTCADSGTVGIVQSYDASQWSGIEFWGISFAGANQTVYVQMDDDRTSPWGGICNACNSTGMTTNPCSDSFRKSVSFTPSWSKFQIAFTDTSFMPQNWSGNGVKPPIHKNKLYNLHFQITATPAPHFDLGVAMIGFYK